jgi:hypothetical protein
VQTVNVEWVLPTERVDNTPLPVSAIEKVVLELAVEGGPFVAIDEFPPDVLSTSVPELSAGTWLFRGTVHPFKGLPSDPVVASITVESDAAPKALKSLVLSFV